MSTVEPPATASPAAVDDARLIALDWGTSNLRAALLGDGGRVLAERSAHGGVMAVPDGRFAQALHDLCGDWIAGPRLPLLASGMIGSRQGWREAAYVACPAALAQVAAQLTQVGLDGGATLHIVPGLCCDGADGQADLMRGEETQLWGADLAPGTVAVHPGTHAKWAWMGEAGRIETFRTYLTGELYGLLTQHGILGRLMMYGSARPQHFEAGVRLGLAEHANATHAIFAARTAGLMGRIEPEGLPDFLSGILIGIEVGSATREQAPARVTVIGDDALVQRYVTALQLAGIGADRAPHDATSRGLWRVALAAGLVASAADAGERA